MSIQSAGNAQPFNVSSSAFDAKVEKTKAKVQQNAKGMEAVIKDMGELSDNIRQPGKNITSKEKSSDLQTQTGRIVDRMQQEADIQQQQIQAQDNAQQAQMGKGKGAEVVAELIAGLMQEEEMGETDDVQKALDEKMQVLIEKAEEFQDIELNDPESNHELQEMFKNVDKFKSLKRREEQLNKNIEDLEINLKEQETREELNKLPMDETTKKIRDQLKISYDQQHQQSQEQDNPQEDDDPESEDQNHSEEES